MAPPWPPGQGPDTGPDPNFEATIDGNHPNNTLWGNEEPPDWFNSEWQPTNETIEILNVWVMNQKPGHVHALGDMFVRAAQLLRELERNVRDHSMTLFSEDWTRAEARNNFMVRGPGRVLAYLQDWATQQAWNIDAMYDLVDPIQQSQKEMKDLYSRYDSEVRAAGEPSFGDTFAASWAAGNGDHQAFSRLDQELAERQEAKRQEFHRAAREIVRKLAGAYKDQFNKMRSGVGAPYEPPNVIMSTPGQQWPDIPAVGAPNLTTPNVGPPNVTTPPKPPAVAPPNLQPVPNGVPKVTAPNLQNVPTAPNLTNPPGAPQVTPPTVGTGAGAPNLPPLPPGISGLNGRTVPNGLTAPNINGVPGGALSPRTMPAGFGVPDINAVPGANTGVTGFSANPGVTPPPGAGRGVTGGVLGRPGAAPGVLPPPGAAFSKRNGTLRREQPLRSPTGSYTATGAPGSAPGVMAPPGGTTGRRQTPTMPAGRVGRLGVPAAFSESSVPPPVAPVLGRQSRRGQPGQHGVYTGPQVGDRGEFAPPSATPPVLNAQSRAGGSALPPPAGIAPQRRRTAGGGTAVPPGGFAAGRGRGAGRYTSQPAPNLVGNPDWLADTTQDAAASTAPVLRNQMTTDPALGAVPPMMPSVPGANTPVIRPAPNTRQQAQGSRGRAAAPSEPELARRSREEQQPETRPGEEAAFTMQTPGGPVVGSTPARQEEAPKPTIGNG